MGTPHNISNYLKSLPNKLTLSRIAVVPLMLIIYPRGFEMLNVLAAILFAGAAMTDFLDGYIARRYQSESPLGAVLDHISDKILITAALVLVVKAGVLPAWIAVLLLCREMAIAGLRLVAKEQNFSVNVNSFGKIKTVAQSAAIFFLMVDRGHFHTVGMILIWVALVLSYYSGYRYWVEFWNHPNVQSLRNESVPVADAKSMTPPPS